MRLQAKRWAAIGAVSATAVVGIVALAGFGWGHGHGQKFMRKMIDAHVEEMLDGLKATPDQRQRVSVLEDRLLADFEANRNARAAAVETLTAQFPNDQLDTAALDRVAEPLKQAGQKLHDDVRQTVVDLHAILTPAQRQQLAQEVARRHERWGKE